MNLEFFKLLAIAWTFIFCVFILTDVILSMIIQLIDTFIKDHKKYLEKKEK